MVFRRQLAFVTFALGAFLLAGCVRQARPTEDGRAPARQVGMASWYGDYHHGKTTANGENFDKNAFTAAHPKLRFGTCVRVKHLDNGREVQVRINDRGPYARGRIIDVSEAAAVKLGMREAGVAKVELLPCR